MNNALAYEILRLMQDEDLHSHSDIHPRVIANSKYINVTPLQTKEVWDLLHKNYCIINVEMSEGVNAYVKNGTKEMYDIINPEKKCISIYKQKAIDDIKNEGKSDKINKKILCWTVVLVILTVVSILLFVCK